MTRRKGIEEHVVHLVPFSLCQDKIDKVDLNKAYIYIYITFNQSVGRNEATPICQERTLLDHQQTECMRTSTPRIQKLNSDESKHLEPLTV